MVRKKIVIIVLNGLFLVSFSLPAIAFPRIGFEHPQSPEEFVDKEVKQKFNPEIKKLAAALAGILILHLLIGKR